VFLFRAGLLAGYFCALHCSRHCEIPPQLCRGKEEKDKKKRFVNILIISGSIFRHCKRSEAIQAQARTWIVSHRSDDNGAEACPARPVRDGMSVENAKSLSNPVPSGTECDDCHIAYLRHAVKPWEPVSTDILSRRDKGIPFFCPERDFSQDIFVHCIAPVIASEAKQSRRRPCSPDGCQSTACAWIASYLAMTTDIPAIARSPVHR
ncbi:MAG: hypothetical protein LBJ47_03050, partial [Tannerella sp.]|nr:hypothetical protein [Tannerella sp.]